MGSNLGNKFCSFIFDFNLFNKLVLQCFIITAIILMSNSNALAVDGTYNGTGTPSGWEIGSVLELGGLLLHAGDGVADGNNLTITNTTESELGSGNISGAIGGWSLNGEVKNNKVTITGGEFTGGWGVNSSIYGGYSDSGTVTGNSVDIGSGATFTNADIYGGYSDSGTVTDNKVNITGGTFTGGSIFGGSSSTGEVKNNSVNITGGNFTGTGSTTSIYGGYSDRGANTVTHNTVTLSGTVTFNETTTLAGGGGPGGGDFRTGNTLILDKATIVGTVSTVENFENYQFNLTYDQIMNSTSLLKAGTIKLGDSANLTIRISDSKEILPLNHEFILMQATTSLTGDFTNKNSTHYILQGISLDYSFGAHIADNKLIGAVNSGPNASQLSTAFVKSRLASFSFMNQANNLILGQGINSAMESIMTNPSHWALFTVLSGVYSSYDTDVQDMKSITGNSFYGGSSFMLGVAKALPIPTGDMLTGIYFETGYGVIGSDISTDLGDMNTDGNAQYYGGGALLRYSIDNGFYTEGFLRIGALTDELQSKYNDTLFNNGSTSMYVGVGVNLGYELKLFKDRDMLDIYTNYTWGHLIGYSHLIDDYNYEFNSINSHQVAVGVQYDFIKQRMFSPFIGVSAEYEFDTESTATIEHNFDISPSSLSGITGVAEIGVRVVHNQKIPLTMALNLGGHFGRRNGVDASFDLEWKFLGKNDETIEKERQQQIKEKKEREEKIEKANIDKAREVQRAINNKHIEAAKELQKLINDDNIQVVSMKEGVAVNVGELLFKTESFELTDEGEKGLILIMNEIKNNYPNKKIIVRGHTDNTGNLKYNQKLSEQRAKNIADKMKGNIDKDKLLYEGKAFTDPIAPNETKEGRAKNRRVEIIIQLDDDTELKR